MLCSIIVATVLFIDVAMPTFDCHINHVPLLSLMVHHVYSMADDHDGIQLTMVDPQSTLSDHS
jgi:hypothetical protein